MRTLGAAPTGAGQIGHTIFVGLTSSVNATGNPGITLSLTPGVWICSYALRLFASSGSPVVTIFYAYMELTTSTNTNTNGFNSYIGSAALGAVGAQNLGLTGCSTIIQTTTQTLTLVAGIAFSGGVLSYFGTASPQTYMQATRIA